ncbi:MAG: hypothetical protein P1U56_10095 [Saprospiraceae bacterium]|nr:hypothetical protein [Saprospiraceae bacterium]
MRNSIIFLLQIFVFGSISAQVWKAELAKHESKPVLEIILEMDKYFDKVGATRANKYHHYVRWQVQAINHMDSDGRLANSLDKNKSLLKRLEKVEENTTKHNRYFQGGWESVNPTNFQNPTNSEPNMGRINAIAISNTNPNIMYAGASGGGIWKTWNHGANWFPLWDGMLQMGVSDILIDYNNENHILVVSGNADSNGIPSSGIIESYDGGITWIHRFKFELSDKKYVYKMVQSPTDQNIFYLNATKLKFTPTSGEFMKINTLTEEVTILPSSFHTVFDMEYQVGSPSSLYLSTNKGLYRMDANENISIVSSGILPITSTRGEIAISLSNSDYIYYLNAISSNNYALYKSVDGGNTFTKPYDNSTSTDPAFLDQISINLNLAIAPNDEESVFVGSVKYSQSNDGGVTFIQDNEGMHPDAHDIVFQNGRHYVCTDGGISYRIIGDTDWLDINNGLLVTQFYKMDKQGNKLVGGTQDNGVLFWDEGDALGIRKIAGDGFDCQYHPTIEDRVLTTNQYFLYISNNNGENNSQSIPHLWAAPIVHWEGNDSIVITFDKEDLRFSYNNGDTWPDSIDIFDNSDAYLLSGFSQCTTNPNVAYASADKQLVKTSNLDQFDNSDWTDITFPINSSLIFRDILVHPTNCDEVYVTLAGYNQEQIYKSIDGGTTWEVYNQGLENIPVYCIYYDSANGNAFYIGTELGIFYRSSIMSEWIPFNTYLPRVQVMDLNITDTHIYAATYGRGIWKSKPFKTCNSNAILTQGNDPTNGNASGFQIHKVSNVLTSDRIIQGGVDTDVLYQAGNYLDLKEGFHAKFNNGFIAKAAGCNN